MSKRLIIFRHAKSDWDAGLADHERPLNERGQRAAAAMGRLLARAGQTPESVICSSAARARATLELAAAAGEWQVRTRIASALYEATPPAVLAEIQAEPDAVETLMLVGHQPTWSELTSALIGGGQIDFATAAMARVDFAVGTWREVDFEKGVLVWQLQPKFFTKGAFKKIIGDFED